MAENPQAIADRIATNGGWGLRPELQPPGPGALTREPQIQFGDELHKFALVDLDIITALERWCGRGIFEIHCALYAARIRDDHSALVGLNPLNVIRAGYRSGHVDGRIDIDPEAFVAKHIGDDQAKAVALALIVTTASITGVPQSV